MSKFQPLISFIKEKFPGQDFIPLHEPRFIGNERKYVLDAIDSTFVSSVGAYVNRFEEMMTEITGTKYAIATVNGTAALHMALLLAGVKKDELVISQSLTFIATCNAISYLGAQPVFVDVDLDTMGMSPTALKNWLTAHTYSKLNEENNQYSTYHHTTHQRIGAIVPMHTFGIPCRIDELISIANEFHIPLVEDAAESLGSRFKNRHTGAFGLLGTYSFNGNKTVTCGGGGCIVTNDETIAKRAKHLTTQAKVPHAWEFNHDQIGYNYRMPNLNAAMACAQLEQVEGFVVKKRNLARAYQSFLESQDIKMMVEPDDSYANYWLCAILLEDENSRNEFLKESNANGVMTRPVWTLMHALPMFKECMRDEQVNSKFLFDRIVNIPSSVQL